MESKWVQQGPASHTLWLSLLTRCPVSTSLLVTFFFCLILLSHADYFHLPISNCIKNGTKDNSIWCMPNLYFIEGDAVNVSDAM